MRPLGGVLGSSWGLLAALGALLGALGASWGRLGRVLGPLEKACEKDVENIFKKEPKEKPARHMNGKRSEKKTNNKHANQSSGTAVRSIMQAI